MPPGQYSSDLGLQEFQTHQTEQKAVIEVNCSSMHMVPAWL